MKRFFSILLTLVFCFALFACGSEKTKTNNNEPSGNIDNPTNTGEKTETKVNPLPELTIDNNEVSLKVNDVYELNYEIKNLEGKDLVDITVSDDNIVSLTNNTLKAINAGECDVTISLKGYNDIKVVVHVTVIADTKLELTGVTSVNVGESIQLSANLEGVSFSSSDESVATIDESGTVTGVKSGTVTITAKLGDKEASLEIKVVNNNIEILSTLFANIDDEIELKASLEGYDGAFFWTTDSEIIELSSDGKLVCLSEGTASINCTAGNINKVFEFVVLPAPDLRVEGPTSVYVGYQIQLTAILINLEGEVSWKSNYPKAATVDENGLVTCVGTGNVVITCTCGEDYSVRYKIECSVEPDRIDLDYDGGVSLELYLASTKKESITINAYGSNGGYYWSNYETHVFIYGTNNDIAPTFSDRIYIGLNPDSGFYEVKGIVTSGPSIWPDDAIYVITYSSSYQGYRAYHALTTTLEVGDIVYLTGNPENLSKNYDIEAYVFDKTPTVSLVSINKDEYTSLPQPTKLGYEFVGWLNTRTNEVLNTLEEVKGIMPLVAQWNELNPVTDIELLDYKEELLVGDTLTVTGKVIPSDAYFQTVNYASSNENIITIDKNGAVEAINAGTCNIIVTDYVGKVTKTYLVTVYPSSQITLSFDKEFDGNMEIDENVTLIGKYFGKDYGDQAFTYTSSDENVLTVDENGRVTAVNSGVATVTIKCKCANLDKELKLDYTINVNKLTDETRADALIKLLAENNFSVVAMGNASLYNDGTNRYYKATYGSVNNYLFDDLVIDRTQAEVARNNENNHKDRTDWHGGIEFVTVHDTATLTSTASSTAASMASGTTSIHYTTGNFMVCQCVPEEFIAYHAGDGTTVQLKWYPTGVEATGFDMYDFSTYPEFDLVKSGSSYYFVINGKQTTIVAPTTTTTSVISNPSKANLTDLGPVWKVVNGEYYLGTTWVDFSQTIAGAIGSHGGNNNSIGIEMGVGIGSNMYDTWLRTSKLVADILIRNDLDLTRVKEHNTWTGKNCPQCIRSGGNWWDFMDMVKVEYIIMKDYSDFTITLSSDSNIINSTGLVTRAPKETTVVNYTITVSNGSVSKSINLSSVVKGTDTWERWNGTYPSSVIWNDGYFDLNKNKK